MPGLTGKHRQAFVPGQNADPSIPEGDGFGAVRVGSNGIATAIATLADGTKLSRSVPLSGHGLWPLYVPLYAGKGSIVSWVAFTNQPGSDVGGLVSWIKPSNALTRFYAGGFTNECQLGGSAYVPPAGVTNRVLNFTNGVVSFSGGNLAADFTNVVAFGLSSKVLNQSSNRLVLSISIPTGTFTGSATDPASGKVRTFGGAVIQKLNAGYGSLMGTNLSSRVILSADP